MNNWQRKIYEQIEGVVSHEVPMSDRDEGCIKFTRTQVYLIKTTIDNLQSDASVLREKLNMARETISALKDRGD